MPGKVLQDAELADGLNSLPGLWTFLAVGVVVTAAVVVSCGAVVVSFGAVVVVSPGAMVVVSSGVKATGMVVVLGAFLSLPFPFLLPGRAHLDLVEVVAAGEVLVLVLAAPETTTASVNIC